MTKIFRKNLKSAFAFTLAEVLITLTIIGIIAAITIPTLMQNYKEAQTVTGLQKAYTTFANAFDMAKTEHGDFTNWSWNQIPSDNAQRIQYFWETYLFPHLKVVDKCFPIEERCFPSSAKYTSGKAAHRTAKHGAFVLSDGMTVQTWASGDNVTNPHIQFFVDINGKKGPNVMGKDIFSFFFYPNQPTTYSTATSVADEEYAQSYAHRWGLSLFGEGFFNNIDDYGNSNIRFGTDKSACSTATNMTGQLCGAWIKANGWKIPKGYPKI